MKNKKNTPEVWDNVWKDKNSKDYDLYNFRKEKKSIHWIRMQKILLEKFGKLEGLNSIEIGAGTGMYSLILASEGVNVTVLDYSKKAIEASKLLFKRNDLNANFVLQDAFNINKELTSKFDISMSFGTAEHFFGKRRKEFIKTHFDVLNTNGITFISVPNKWNMLYRVHKFLSESLGRWSFGEEYPFSQIEFRRIGKTIKHNFNFIGHSIFSDPFLIYSRIKKILRIKKDYKKLEIKKQTGTFLDKYFARFITAVAVK